jgi:hypothetical protein
MIAVREEANFAGCDLNEFAPYLWGRLSVTLKEGKQGCILVSDRPRWHTRVPFGYIAKIAKYLHSLFAENERRDEKMRILQVRLK